MIMIWMIFLAFLLSFQSDFRWIFLVPSSREWTRLSSTLYHCFCYVFASQEFNLVFIVFPFLVSFKTMTRDHLHKASRLAPRRVQTLVVIKLYFIDPRQGEELEMVKFSPFIWGVLKSACRIVLPYRSFSHDFTAAIYKTKWRSGWHTQEISWGLDSCHVKMFFCSKQIA